MPHTCHAPDCDRFVAPKLLFCREHWFGLPLKIRNAIWLEYTPGQEKTKRPTWRYMAVQRLACAYTVFKPDSEQAVLETLPYIADAMRYAKNAVEAGLGDPLENLIPREWPVPALKEGST